MRIASLVCLLFSISLACLRAQKPEVIQKVQVIGRAPSWVKVSLDSSTMALFRQTNVGELLQSISPIGIMDYGRGARQAASFRGTDPSHTNIYWNSMIINSPIEGSVDLSLLPLFSLDKLSITPGISSVANGSGALGGVVELNSEAHWDGSTSGQARFGYGSFSSCWAMGSLRVSGRKFESSTKVVYDRSKNDFTFQNRDIIDPANPGHKTWQKNLNAQYSNIGLSQDFYIKINNDQTISISLLGLKNERDIPQLTSYEGPLNSHLTRSSDQSLRSVVSYVKHSEKFRIHASLGATIEENRFTKNNLVGSQYVENINSTSLGRTLQAMVNLSSFHIKDHTVKSSTKLLVQNASSQERVHNTGFNRTGVEFSQMVGLDSRWLKNLSSTALARLDIVRGKVSASCMVGIQYTPRNDFSFAIRGGHNEHHPTLSNLYYTPTGNPDLKSERGPTVELAMSYNNKWADISLTLYDSWIDDWIVWLPTAAQYWTPLNLRRVEAMGVELTATGKWHLGQSFKLSITLCGALNRTINRGEPLSHGDMSQGSQLPFVPLFSTGWIASCSYHNKLTLTYSGNGESEKNNSTAGNQSRFTQIEPFVFHNLTLLYRPWTWGAIELNCKNLLNSHFYGIQRRALAPRYFGASLLFELF